MYLYLYCFWKNAWLHQVWERGVISLIVSDLFAIFNYTIYVSTGTSSTYCMFVKPFFNKNIWVGLY